MVSEGYTFNSKTNQFEDSGNQENPDKSTSSALLDRPELSLNKPKLSDRRPSSSKLAQDEDADFVFPAPPGLKHLPAIEKPKLGKRQASSQSPLRSPKRKRSESLTSPQATSSESQSLSMLPAKTYRINYSEEYGHIAHPSYLSGRSIAWREDSSKNSDLTKTNGLFNMICVDVFQTSCYADDVETGFFHVDGRNKSPSIQDIERPPFISVIQGCCKSRIFTSYSWIAEYATALRKKIVNFDDLVKEYKTVTAIFGGSNSFDRELSCHREQYVDVAEYFVRQMDKLSVELNTTVIFMGMPNPTPENHPGRFIMEIDHAIRRSADSLKGSVYVRDLLTLNRNYPCCRSNKREFEEFSSYRQLYVNPHMGQIIHDTIYAKTIGEFDARDV
jgi:hypothetical protein